MKSLFFILMIAPSFMMVDSNLDEISTAIRNGDATALSEFFDQNVEVAILDDEDTYDKAQAKAVVQSFFAKHKPTNFSQVHKGASKGKDAQYCIGNLKSGKESFRVYLFLKVSNGKHIIQELRFDKE
ncbi:MAG: DUF4783 domain-containing protein [Saprospiraceae bacterium]